LIIWHGFSLRKEEEMKSKIYLIMGVLALVTLFLGTVCHAELCRVKANVSVTTFEDVTKENRLDVGVEVFDSNNKRPPDVVRWVKLKFPDRTEINITEYWEEYWDDFGVYIPASQLPGGVIQSGKYRIRVKDRSTGKIIVETDDLNASNTLTPPSITSPSEEDTVSGLEPTITWTKVPGARTYRLQLVFCGNNGPLGGDGPLWYPHKVPYFDDNATYYKVPKGVLRGGKCYQVRVEALDQNAFRDHRGRSKWVHFYTP
jgi:hypothetical protein